MKEQIFRGMRWFAFALMVLSSARCNSGGDSSDGKTSWLRQCKDDSDCDGKTSCECGVCTLPCSGANECTGLAAPSTCVEARATMGDACRVGVAANAGVCLPGCQTVEDCPADGFRCESGLCLPSQTMVGNDAGVVEPLGSGGARATGGTDAGNESGGAATGGTTSGGTAPDTGGAPPAGGKGGSDPVPSSGPVNAYGGPVETTADFTSMCPGRPYDSVNVGCRTFNTCKYTCNHDVDCPTVAGGTAVPICDFDSMCRLLCDADRTCPPGMVCGESFLGRFCAWQSKVDEHCGDIDPCRATPLPAFCPKRCSDVGVACDDALGTTCCDGFTCGPEHYCVKSGG